MDILLHISGSIEHFISGPFLLRVSVKCFSIIQAPNATAASTATDPTEWSEKPTKTSPSKNFFISVIQPKFISLSGHG